MQSGFSGWCGCDARSCARHIFLNRPSDGYSGSISAAVPVAPLVHREESLLSKHLAEEDEIVVHVSAMPNSLPAPCTALTSTCSAASTTITSYNRNHLNRRSERAAGSNTPLRW